MSMLTRHDETDGALGRAIVHLDPDHPGFRDAGYRARRDAIARLALDYLPGAPVPEVRYTAEEHALWRAIRAALEPAHRRHACAEYLVAARALDLPRGRVPQLEEVSARVERSSGFRLEPVAGLVEPRVFLGSLAGGVFLATQYIRHHSSPFYTPEPDVVHEIVGHAVSLASPRLAELNRLVGAAVRRTTSPEALDRLSRLYWFTLEFGVVREGAAVKAVGAGLLSSVEEIASVERAALRPMDFDRASREGYDPTSLQPVLYCADSFDAFYSGLRDYLLEWR